MGSCMSTEAAASGNSSKQSKDGGMGRLSTQYASMYRCELFLDLDHLLPERPTESLESISSASFMQSPRNAIS